MSQVRAHVDDSSNASGVTLALAVTEHEKNAHVLREQVKDFYKKEMI